MSDRKIELEKKKAQLEELRRQRQQRAQTVQQAPTTAVSADEILKTHGISIPEATPASIQRAETVAASPINSSPRPRRRLNVSKLNEISCAPSERITYARETQTTETLPNAPVLTYDENQHGHRDVDNAETFNELEKMPHIGIMNEANEKEEPEINEFEKEISRIKENAFSEEERNMIMNSENFKGFFDRYARIIERAVCETEVDVLTDYGGLVDADSDKNAHEVIKKTRDFQDEHWSRRRVVTSLNWSPIFPELLLASYHCNDDAPHEPDGVCLVWNLKYKKDSPEYVLHCQSPLMSACMPNFHPSLIVGGTYSGQIVLWDIRTNKRTPIQRSPLSAACHTHPINQMSVIGTQNAHNLISISSDGRMCSWSMEMLSAPSETLELQRQTKTVALTSIDFFANDVNNFIVGSEDGLVYPGIRHGEKEKQGLGVGLEGHLGPISGVSCHKVGGPLEFPHLFLTSSFDWTVKLWSSRDGSQSALHSFEDAGDYIYDVGWSPVHPGVFASCDGEGALSVWDLTADVEVPAGKCQVTGSAALNKLAWHGGGQYIAVGGDQGRVSIMDVGETLYQPSSSVWSGVAQSLGELQQQQASGDYSTPAGVSGGVAGGSGSTGSHMGGLSSLLTGNA